MSDRTERIIASSARWLKAYRATENTWRLRAGLRVCRTERAYASGAVKRLAAETNISRSALYEYADIALMVFQVGPALGFSARRIFEVWPALDYSHLRIAARYFKDIEDRIDALLMAMDLGLTPEQFAVEIRKWRGDSVAPAPVFDERGAGGDVVAAFLETVQRLPNWRQRQLRITVR